MEDVKADAAEHDVLVDHCVEENSKNQVEDKIILLKQAKTQVSLTFSTASYQVD